MIIYERTVVFQGEKKSRPIFKKQEVEDWDSEKRQGEEALCD